MKKILSVFFIILLFNIAGKSQQQKTIKDYLQNRQEAYITIKLNNKNDIKILDKIVGIDKRGLNINLGEINAYVSPQQYQNLLKTNYKFEVKTPPSLVQDVDMCTGNNTVTEWNCYPTYEQYIYLMNKFVEDYPNICSLHEIGESVDGRKVLAVKISDNVNEDEEEPEFFYTATMHGDETAGYVLMNRLIDYLLSNYEASDRIKELIDTKEIWINPLANPDGTYADGNSTVNGATRNNSNSKDLNRNFPDPVFGEYPGGTRQVETQDMMDFMQAHNFLLSANFHGGAEVVNYPWDTWGRLHGDDAWYKNISQKYADVVHNNSTGYMTDFDNGITNGYDWYPIHGGRQDYVNYNLHSREITIELSNNKTTSASELNNLWMYNFNSFLDYIENLNTYVYGVITDVDGNPIKAGVYLQTDKDNSEVFSKQETGVYYRLLSSGNYTLTFKAEGYVDKEFQNVSISNNNKTELNVQLEKSNNTDIETISDNNFKLISYINPFKDKLNIEFELSQETEVQALIYNISGKLILDTKKNIYNTGVNSLNINTQTLKKGYYMCVFKSKNISFDFKLIKM